MHSLRLLGLYGSWGVSAVFISELEQHPRARNLNIETHWYAQASRPLLLSSRLSRGGGGVRSRRPLLLLLLLLLALL
jgi:hypothetical protein